MPRAGSVAPQSLAPDFVSNQGLTCALEEGEFEDCRWHYQDSRSYVVTSGMPTGPDPGQAVEALVEWAGRRGQTPILFGVEPHDLPFLPHWRVREIGRQPLFIAGTEYNPELSGPKQPARGREVRRQARRALAKGVDWFEVPAGEVWEAERRGHLDVLLLTRWRRQPLAEFSFLVALHLSMGESHRRYFLLRPVEGGTPSALAILVRSDRGWLLEHSVVGKGAPNGSGELLACRLLSAALTAGDVLSMGITPLYRALVPDLPHQEIPGILSFLPGAARSALVAAWEPLYGFRRLQTYREKLEPVEWEPVYWAHPRGLPPFVLWAVLRVFADGPLLGFAGATVLKVISKLSMRLRQDTLQKLNALFVVSLCIWIPILWHLDGALVFGAPLAPKIWATFDVLLVLGFYRHGLELKATRRRFRIGPFLLGLVTADAVLSLIWTAMLHGRHPASWALGIFLIFLNAAPLSAAAFLTVCQSRRPHFLRHGGKRPAN